MPEQCGRTFDEALLSGYVDHALTQGDEQRVRVHMEDCATCRALVADMSQLKEVTMSSHFSVPVDDQWSEASRGAVSRAAFRAGWGLVLVWGVAAATMALWAFWTSDESTREKLVGFAIVLGPLLLLVSVLVDRLKALKTDRYRGVQK
jgi:anti-sigma factor RsiW